METRHIIRDPMTLGFLDLPEADVYTETKLSKIFCDSVTYRAESMPTKDERGDIKAKKLMDYDESRQRKRREAA